MGLDGGGDLAEVLQRVVAPAARRRSVRRRGRVEGVHLSLSPLESNRLASHAKCAWIFFSPFFFSSLVDGFEFFESSDKKK